VWDALQGADVTSLPYHVFYLWAQWGCAHKFYASGSQGFHVQAGDRIRVTRQGNQARDDVEFVVRQQEASTINGGTVFVTINCAAPTAMRQRTCRAVRSATRTERGGHAIRRPARGMVRRSAVGHRSQDECGPS
jgi:hypothetical protein